MKRITINHKYCSYGVWFSLMGVLREHPPKHHFSESTLTASDDIAAIFMGGRVMGSIFGMNEASIGNKISLRY